LVEVHKYYRDLSKPEMLANMPGASLAKKKSFGARTVKLLLTLRHMVESQLVEYLD
jgi:hypothetical protein